MDPPFYILRKDRRQVIGPLLEDPVKFLVMEPSAMSTDDYAEKLPVHEATHNVNFHTYQRPPVATQVQYYHQPFAQNQQVSLFHRDDPVYHDKQASQAPPPVNKTAPGKVIDSNEAARIYGGYVIKGQAPPPVKNPAPGKVIDSNEAARIYGAYVIKGQAPPPVKNPAPGKVIDSNEAARIYGGYVIKGQAPPPVKNPAPGKVIDSNEAARIYGGVVIKDFGRNNNLPGVRSF